MRLLIAEDDPALAGFLARGLLMEGNEIEVAHDGDAALAEFLRCLPDLCVLDLEMPGLSGLAVLNSVTAIAPLVPVLVLSGRADVETRITCLEQGAEDCMLKPFALRELQARCRALLRRAAALKTAALLEGIAPGLESSRHSTIVVGCLTMNRLGRQVEIAGASLHLTNLEFALLEQLALANGAAVSRITLREIVWPGKQLETNTLDVHIGALRRKLGLWPGAPAIETVRGSGFSLALPPVPPVGRQADAPVIWR